MSDDSQDEESAPQGIKGSPPVNVAAPNWKAGLALGKVRPMPEKGYKKSLGLIQHKSLEKPEKVAKIPKAIAPIGKRTKERIAKFGTETALHDVVWGDRLHRCCMCAQNIVERAPYCFAHKLSKGMYEKYRYLPENIGLVCSMDCHAALDKMYQGKLEVHIDMRNNLIEKLDKILLANSTEDVV